MFPGEDLCINQFLSNISTNRRTSFVYPISLAMSSNGKEVVGPTAKSTEVFGTNFTVAKSASVTNQRFILENVFVPHVATHVDMVN